MSRSILTLSTVFAWIPTLTWLVLLAFAATAYFCVGHWPQYGQPDPKALGLPLFHGAALLSYPIALVALIAGSIWLCATARPWTKARIAVFILGGALWLVSLPKTGPLLSWILD